MRTEECGWGKDKAVNEPSLKANYCACEPQQRDWYQLNFLHQANRPPIEVSALLYGLVVCSRCSRIASPQEGDKFGSLSINVGWMFLREGKLGKYLQDLVQEEIRLVKDASNP